MKYWAKQATFWHKQGGVLPVFCWLLWSHIAVTEDLPPPQSIYTGIRGARIIKNEIF